MFSTERCHRGSSTKGNAWPPFALTASPQPRHSLEASRTRPKRHTNSTTSRIKIVIQSRPQDDPKNFTTWRFARRDGKAEEARKVEVTGSCLCDLIYVSTCSIHINQEKAIEISYVEYLKTLSWVWNWVSAMMLSLTLFVLRSDSERQTFNLPHISFWKVWERTYRKCFFGSIYLTQTHPTTYVWGKRFFESERSTSSQDVFSFRTPIKQCRSTLSQWQTDLDLLPWL